MIKLSARPLGRVVVRTLPQIESDCVRVDSGAALHFDVGNWDTWQRVRIAAKRRQDWPAHGNVDLLCTALGRPAVLVTVRAHAGQPQ